MDLVILFVVSFILLIGGYMFFIDNTAPAGTLHPATKVGTTANTVVPGTIVSTAAKNVDPTAPVISPKSDDIVPAVSLPRDSVVKTNVDNVTPEAKVITTGGGLINAETPVVVISYNIPSVVIIPDGFQAHAPTTTGLTPFANNLADLIAANGMKYTFEPDMLDSSQKNQAYVGSVSFSDCVNAAMTNNLDLYSWNKADKSCYIKSSDANTVYVNNTEAGVIGGRRLN